MASSAADRTLNYSGQRDVSASGSLASHTFHSYVLHFDGDESPWESLRHGLSVFAYTEEPACLSEYVDSTFSTGRRKSFLNKR